MMKPATERKGETVNEENNAEKEKIRREEIRPEAKTGSGTEATKAKESVSDEPIEESPKTLSWERKSL